MGVEPKQRWPAADQARRSPSSDVRTQALKGVDIRESTLGLVPLAAFAQAATNASNAENAASATTAETPNVANDAAHATSADNATQADTADQVNGVAAQGGLYRTDNATNNPTAILQLGGLTLTANCTSRGPLADREYGVQQRGPGFGRD